MKVLGRRNLVFNAQSTITVIKASNKMPICASLWTWFLEDTNTNSSHILHWLWHGLQKTHTNFSHLLYQLWHVSQKTHTNFTHLFSYWLWHGSQKTNNLSHLLLQLQQSFSHKPILLESYSAPPPPPPPPPPMFGFQLSWSEITHTHTHTHTEARTRPHAPTPPHSHMHTHTHARTHKVCRLNVNTLLPLLPACLADPKPTTSRFFRPLCGCIRLIQLSFAVASRAIAVTDLSLQVCVELPGLILC